MSQTTAHALLLLDAQRHHFETSTIPHRLGAWREAVAQARRSGVLVVFLQRDGESGSGLEPLTRGWTLHPDFRVEDGDVLLRVTSNNAFEGGAFTGKALSGGALGLELRSRGVTRLSVLAVPGNEAATALGAQQAGFEVATWHSEILS